MVVTLAVAAVVDTALCQIPNHGGINIERMQLRILYVCASAREDLMHGSAMTLHNRRTLKLFIHDLGSSMTLHNTRVPMRSGTHQNSVYGSTFKYCKYVEPIQYENANAFWIHI